MPGANPQANLILSFEYKGGWRDVKGAVVMTVLTFLLGGGSSFSSGGPGKGMHSRLYTRVLNQHHWVHSCSAFSSTFNSSGEEREAAAWCCLVMLLGVLAMRSGCTALLRTRLTGSVCTCSQYAACMGLLCVSSS